MRGAITGWSLIVNDAPRAEDDSDSTNKDIPLSVPASEGVLANDTDPDGDTLSAVLVSGPAHGTLSLNANGSFTYKTGCQLQWL